MRKIFLFLLTSVFIAYPQIDKYLDDTSSTVVECADYFIIRPTITSNIVGFDINNDESHNASSMICYTIKDKLKGSVVIKKDELDNLKDCKGQIFIVKVENYHTEPARLSQNKGTITVVVYIFRTLKDKEPYKKFIFIADGDRHWGDTTPFENAVKAVSKEIKKENFHL